MLKKGMALLLAVLLLPATCLSEAFTYDITFSSRGGVAGTVMEGLLDLLNMLEISGTYLKNTDPGLGFEIETSVLLDQDEKTRVDVELYGIDAIFHMRSDLWNREALFINVPAMLEFAMKIYNHMDIPLQRFALLYPYVTQEAIVPVWDTVQSHILAARPQENATFWDVDPSVLLQLAETIADMSYSDRSFRIWLEAMSSINEGGEMLSEIAAQLPEYVMSLESGLRVRMDEEGCTWALAENDTVLFHEEAPDSDHYQCDIYLPAFVDETDLAYHRTIVRNGDTSDDMMHFSLGEDDSSLLAGTIDMHHIPSILPVAEPFTIDIHLTGKLLHSLVWLDINEKGELDSLELTDHLDCSIAGDQNVVSVMMDSVPVISAHLNAQAIESYDEPYHTPYETFGLNLFSLYDSTLHEFVSSMRDNVIAKGIPILVHAPVTTVVTLMDVLQDGGVLDLLSGEMEFGSGGEDGDSYDWDAYEGEDDFAW